MRAGLSKSRKPAFLQKIGIISRKLVNPTIIHKPMPLYYITNLMIFNKLKACMIIKAKEMHAFGGIPPQNKNFELENITRLINLRLIPTRPFPFWRRKVILQYSRL